MGVETPEEHESLIQAMMDPTSWPAGGVDRRRVDTHISTVVLAGDLAYKIKKPLDLGFLDFLTLPARETACHEELRLNRRLAPQIYRRVCRITGSIDRPEIDGKGPLLDWAVVMRRFDPDAILSQQADRLTPSLVDRLAEVVAGFHAEVDRASEGTMFGEPRSVIAPMQQNFDQIAAATPPSGSRLDPLQRWTQEQFVRLTDVLSARKAEGFVRECHGDLHLGNVALIDGDPVVFDAIEFNPAFRWIDVQNDLAFMTMDLQQRGHVPLARRFLNRYLQVSGDYPGIALLRFYEVYRALVRAKIAAIRLGQVDLDERERTAVRDELDAYLGLAECLISPRRGGILIMRGVSGSGKSHVAEGLTDWLPAVCVRSDVERKRLMGLSATADATGRDGYSADMTQATYARLAESARAIAGAGFVAVADATFLKRAQRDVFRSLADQLQVPFAIIDCGAPVEVLEQRIAARTRDRDNVSDADRSVLAAQLAAQQPLGEDERALSFSVTPDHPLDHTRLAAHFA